MDVYLPSAAENAFEIVNPIRSTMKQLLRSVTVLLLAGFVGLSSSRAQDIKPAVAFVKADRTELFLKKTDSAATVILKAIPPYLTSITNLAILGQTPGGNSYLLGGAFTYLDAGSSTLKTFTGIVAVPSNIDPTNPIALTQIKFLQASPYGSGAFRPLGVVSSDGKEWVCCFISSAPGNQPLRFYHGNMDGSGTIDSATLTGNLADKAIEGGFHISNLALSPDNSTMLAVSVDHLESAIDERYQLYRWNVHAFGGPQFNVSGDFASSMHQLRSSISNVDSLFGLTVHVEDDTWLDLGITNDKESDNSISFYRIRYTASNVSLTAPTLTIPRSVIPSDRNFFAGMNTSSYRETESDAGQPGAGGDMMFNAAGDEVVFVTHESPDNANNRNIGSAIYTYKFGDASATLIYDDSSAQELQPLFVDALYKTPESMPGVTLSTSSIDFGKTDTNTTVTKNLIVTDTAKVNTNFYVTIAGTDAGSFSITGGPSFSATPGQPVSIPVLFTPTGVAGPRTATITVHLTTPLPDSLYTISLAGEATVKEPVKSVREDESLALNVTMSPNPFASSTDIHLTAAAAGTIGIVVHDALGKTVYTSDLRHVGAGAMESFRFDANSLGLPNGVYYVSALFGDRQISRQVVYIR